MITEETKQAIGKLIEDACNDDAQGKRSDLFDRYMAEHYEDAGLAPIKGRSQFLDSTASDAVEAVLPDLMDVFTSSKRLMDFDPIGPEDEEPAKQEADVCSHIFWQKNPGFENLYVWIKEALIQQNSYVWSGWVEKERVTIEEYEDLTDVELVSIIGQLDGDYDFLEQSGFEVVENEETGEEYAVSEVGDDGQPAPISVKIRCVKKTKEYVIEPFPNEEYFGTPRWNKVGLTGIPCCGRKREVPEEEMRALGFSDESIKKATQGEVDDEQTATRHDNKDSSEQEADNEDVMVYEAFVMVDLHGKGRLSLAKVWAYGDGTDFFKWKDGSYAIDEVSHVQISALTPFIISHRHIGRALVELVDDIQKIKTVMMRQLLDSTYRTTFARPVFDESEAGEHTYDDLSNPDAGAAVRSGGAEITWHSPPSIAPAILPIMEKMNDLAEGRTGATRYNQGLDAESLNKTMGGMQMIMNASQKKMKLIARTLAETGIRDLFLRMHADLRSGPAKEMALKLNGQWAEVDPRTWKHRTDMTVTVGMGKGDNDMIRAGMMALGQIQRELKASGSRMVNDQNIFAAIERTAQTYGIDHIAPFINDPSQLPPEQPKAPPPDPAMEMIKSQDQKNQADARRDAEKLAADERERGRKHQEAMRKLDLEESKAASAMMTDEERLELDQKRAILEDDFKRDKLLVETAVQTAPPVDYRDVTR